MDFINSLADESKVEFKVLQNSSDAELWCNLWEQCSSENSRIEKQHFTVHKLKRKLRNVMKMVKIYNSLISITPVHKECMNCQILADNVDDLQNQIELKNILLSELYNDVKKISVVTRSGSSSSERQETEQSLIPQVQSITDDDVYDEAAMRRKMLSDKTANLNLQIFDKLMSIVREIPPYDETENAFTNFDIFESHTDKFCLTNEQKNVCFRVWLPCQLSRRLKSPTVTNEGETIHDNETDRLKQLILFCTGEESPTIEILESLQLSDDEDTFTFMKKFEQAYRMIMGVNQDQAAMIKIFVKRFTCLDPTSIVLAAEKPTLEEAATFIDRIRRQPKSEDVYISEDMDEDSEQREGIATPRSVDVYRDRLRIPEQREHVICYYCKRPGHIKRQCWEFQIRNLEIESEFSYPDDNESEFSYTPELRQISKLTVNSKIRTCNGTDGEGLLPSPLMDRDLTPLPLEFVSPIQLDDSGRPHVQGLLKGRKTKFLIDTGAQLSVTRHKLPLKPNSPECTIVGFNGRGNSIARMVSDVAFEIPGFVKTNIDIWYCDGAENIIGTDVMRKQGWVIDLGNRIIWKDPSNPKSVLIDPSMYSNVGSICTTDVSSEHRWPDTGNNAELRKVVESCPCLWTQFTNEIGTLKDVELNIEGRDPSPQQQYKFPPQSIGPVSAIIQEFLHQGVLRKANSVVNNCVWPIRRDDGSYSLSIDFRMLNKLIPNHKPNVPNNPDIMSKLNSKAEVFSVLEIGNSHLSVSLARQCQYKFAFSFQNEQYVFTRLPPGLDISDSIVHESVAKVLSNFSRPECITQHVDQLLLSTETIEEHHTLLSELFSLLQESRFKLNADKAQLMREEVEFLTMLISPGKRQLLRELVRAISAVPIPKSHKTLKRFLSQMYKCREFIQGFAEKSKPLYDLLKNKDVFGRWSPVQQKAFVNLKKDLQSAPALGTVEFSSSAKFAIQTHTSENAISTTLSQRKDGNERVIGNFSRCLTPKEKDFPLHVRQLLGVYFAVKVTEHIVGSNRIILKTSDSLLKSIIEGKDSEELYKKFPQWCKVLSSKQIDLDLVAGNTQDSDQSCVTTNICEEPSVFRKDAEKGPEPVFINAAKAHSGGDSISGYAIWYPMRKYGIQQRLPEPYSEENAELEAIKTVLAVNEEMDRASLVIYSDRSVVVKSLTDLESLHPIDKDMLHKESLKTIFDVISKSPVNYTIVRISPHMKDKELSMGSSIAHILAKDSLLLQHTNFRTIVVDQNTSTHVSNFVEGNAKVSSNATFASSRVDKKPFFVCENKVFNQDHTEMLCPVKPKYTQIPSIQFSHERSGLLR